MADITTNTTVVDIIMDTTTTTDITEDITTTTETKETMTGKRDLVEEFKTEVMDKKKLCPA